MPVSISVSHLTKTFRFSVREKGRGWLRNLFRPAVKEITAVNDISFSVSQGERVAFIGPNGAGKSTTIKMLTGILYPTSGSIRVLGLDPTRARKKLAYRIGTVFGQRSQLLPNLPLTDSMEFFGVMYDMTDRAIERRTATLTDLFDLGPFRDQPVRKLSLGQRMRAEVAASLIHSPEIILLDEPTIGLDVVAKKSLRDLLLRVNKEEGTTVFLTSHDTGDIESLATRTIVINHGVLIKDLPTEDLARAFIASKYIDLTPVRHFSRFPALPQGITYITKGPHLVTVVVDLKILTTQEALRALIDLFEVEDIDAYDVDLETVIRHIYGHTTDRA